LKKKIILVVIGGAIIYFSVMFQKNLSHLVLLGLVITGATLLIVGLITKYNPYQKPKKED